jgi:hypothetical protein
MEDVSPILVILVDGIAQGNVSPLIPVRGWRSYEVGLRQRVDSWEFNGPSDSVIQNFIAPYHSISLDHETCLCGILPAGMGGGG